MSILFTQRQASLNASTFGDRIPKCGKCGLCKKCISPKMEPTGDGSRKILFVAEAPGEEEDRQGIQLIGKAGMRLRDSLDAIDVDLEACWKTNAVICRPPDNKMEPYMAQCCRPNLVKTIKELKPNVIVALGATALKSILASDWKKDFGKFTRWVGWAIPSKTFNCWIVPTYHPSYILRMGGVDLLVRVFEDHLLRAVRLEKKRPRFVDLKDLESQVELITNERQIVSYLKRLSRAKGTLAFDYETTGLKPDVEKQDIVCMSFCLNGRNTFAFPTAKKLYPYIADVLTSRNLQKIASNLKFEDRWTKAKLGVRVRNWYWDTMIAAHILDNRPGICSLKFQSFVNFGISDYDSHVEQYLRGRSANGFNRIRELDVNELLLYCGLDSLLEHMMMKRQTKQLSKYNN